MRSLSSRLHAYARKAVIPAMLLGATVSGLGLSATAHAADSPSCSVPSQTCPAGAPWRGAQPNGVSDQDWRGAVTAANFWNVHQIHRGDARLVDNQGGWPGDTQGRGWYSYNTGTWLNPSQWWIYYGGQFNDRDGRIAAYEASFNVPNQYTNGPLGAYREYDVNAHQFSGNGIRDAVRIVRNVYTGHVYATFDHYNTFHYLGRW